MFVSGVVPSLKLPAKAPENTPLEWKFGDSEIGNPRIFRGLRAVSFREGNWDDPPSTRGRDQSLHPKASHPLTPRPCLLIHRLGTASSKRRVGGIFGSREGELLVSPGGSIELSHVGWGSNNANDANLW